MALALISYVKAGEILSLDPQTISRYVKDGRLTGYTVGPRAKRVDRAEVEALAEPINVSAAS